MFSKISEENLKTPPEIDNTRKQVEEALSENRKQSESKAVRVFLASSKRGNRRTTGDGAVYRRHTQAKR